jgi:hypothetical protein
MLFMDHNASGALVALPQNLSRQPYVLIPVKEEVQVRVKQDVQKSLTLFKF